MHGEGVLGCCGWVISDRRTFTARCLVSERTAPVAVHQLGLSGLVQPGAAITSPCGTRSQRLHRIKLVGVNRDTQEQLGAMLLLFSFVSADSELLLVCPAGKIGAHTH